MKVKSIKNTLRESYLKYLEDNSFDYSKASTEETNKVKEYLRIKAKEKNV